MENIFTLYTWDGLRNLFLLLLAGYWILRLVEFLIKQVVLKNRANKQILIIFKKILLIYQPISILLILFGFLAINYLIHGFFLLLIGALGFPYLRNYISGVILKINSLLRQGISISVADTTGEINKFLPFGIIINTESGDSFVSYTTIDKFGFKINSKNDTILRQTLYLKTEKSKTEILDLLFDNLLLNFKVAPTINTMEGTEVFKLQYTLEKGIKAEDLIAFFKQYNIETSLTNNTSN